jgi:hypothetical protein
VLPRTSSSEIELNNMQAATSKAYEPRRSASSTSDTTHGPDRRQTVLEPIEKLLSPVTSIADSLSETTSISEADLKFPSTRSSNSRHNDELQYLNSRLESTLPSIMEGHEFSVVPSFNNRTEPEHYLAYFSGIHAPPPTREGTVVNSR